MSKRENDPRYVSPDRVKKLAFLFRREIASRMRKTPAELDVLASTISGALRGDDDTNEATRFYIDLLIKQFHPDKQQRREAAQRLLDGLEFGFDSEIKQAEFIGDLASAESLRRLRRGARMDMEKDLGKLQDRVTIDDQQAPVPAVLKP